MESDWRFNVWLIGAWGDRMELAARLHGPFPQPTFVCKDRLSTTHYLVTTLNIGGDSPYSSSQFPIPAAHPHFPYGFDCEPDTP